MIPFQKILDSAHIIRLAEMAGTPALVLHTRRIWLNARQRSVRQVPRQPFQSFQRIANMMVISHCSYTWSSSLYPGIDFGHIDSKNRVCSTYANVIPHNCVTHSNTRSPALSRKALTDEDDRRVLILLGRHSYKFHRPNGNALRFYEDNIHRHPEFPS